LGPRTWPLERDQASLLGVQSQTVLAKTLADDRGDPPSIRFVHKHQDKIVRVADQFGGATQARFHVLLKPFVQHIMQIDVGQQRRNRPANNVAKSWLTFDTVIPRSRLKSIRGQGPDFEVQVDKEVTSTRSVGGDAHGRKKPKRRKSSGPS